MKTKQELLDELKLQLLEIGGVDNWQGYGEFETIDVGKTEKDVISDTKKLVKGNSESNAEDFVDLFDFDDEKTEKTT